MRRSISILRIVTSRYGFDPRSAALIILGPMFKIQRATHWSYVGLLLAGCVSTPTLNSPKSLSHKSVDRVHAPLGDAPAGGLAAEDESLKASDSMDQLWETAKDTLRRRGCPLDVVDRSTGLITTIPVNSQHLFEFWRKDVCTWHDLWEATLNPMRRRVEVRFHSGAETSEGSFEIVVHKERLSAPDLQFNSTGAAYQYFGDSLPATTGLPSEKKGMESWLDRGRDAAMERELYQAIRRGAGMTPP